MTNWSRFTTSVASVFAMLAIGAIGGAGIAHAAPEDDYIYDLNSNGIGGPRGQLIQLGREACAGKAGTQQRDAVATITSETELSASDATFLYESALLFLCP